MDDEEKRRFYAQNAKAFRGARAEFPPCEWRVGFVGREIRIPIAPETAWLDWDLALSLLGHEPDIKQTYAALLGSDLRPDVFLDVGANYGTHTVLFMAHGVECIAFEPNPSCHAGIRRLCEANGLEPRIEGVALGESPGEVELWYPEGQTWLGTIRAEGRSALEARHRLACAKVPMATLDDFMAPIGTRRALLKIDTEGFDIQILKGGTRMLSEKRPLVIFESCVGTDRETLAKFFAGLDYSVGGLPWRPIAWAPLAAADFLASPAMNFVAVPTDGESHESPKMSSSKKPKNPQ